MIAREYLEKLVATQSTRGQEAAIADYLETVLADLGFTCTSVSSPEQADRRNILATRGRSPKLCCYGHIDTVPIYDGWNTNPLVLTQKEDRLYGLGANDMKGGIAALLAAIERLPKDLPLKIILCYDEEYDSDGAWLVVLTQAEWFKDVTHFLSVEPGTASALSSTEPTITLGRRGRARYEVAIHGFSAHGGSTEKGISAISLAAQYTLAVESSPMATHPQLGTGSQYVAQIQAKAGGLSLPDRCNLDIERHFVPPETVESVGAQYQKLGDELIQNLSLTPEQRKLVTISLRPKLRTNPYMEAFVTPVDDPFVQIAVELMDEIMDKHTITYGRSVADDNILANTLGKKVLTIGPKGGSEHSPNEWVSEQSLELYTDYYRALLSKAAEL